MKTLITNLVKTIFIICVLLISNLINAQVHSTGAGGDWSDGATWVGGVPPGTGDDVVINGVVSLDINTSCQNITIDGAGTLQNKSNASRTLTVNGNITNQGTTKNNTYYLTLDIHGDIYNNKIWQNAYTNLVSASDQDLWTSQPFMGAYFNNSISTKNVNITSNTVSFLGCRVDMGNCNMVFGNGDLSVTGHYFQNAVITADQLDFTVHGGAYLLNVTCNTNHAWLRGIINVMNNVVFDDNTLNVIVEVVDTLQNRSVGNYTFTVNGDLHNNGLIRNNNHNLTIDVTGSIVNSGTWQNAYTNLTGGGNQYLTFYQGFNGANFTSNKLTGVVTATTALRFNNTIVDFNGDSLQMNTGNDSIFLNNGRLIETTILASGGSPWQVYFHLSNNAYADEVYIEANEVVLDGIFQFVDIFEIIGNVRVEGTLQNLNGGHRTATFTGNVTNNGTIQNNNYNCYLYITGDITQNGTWTNNHTYLSGDVDQNLSFTTGFNGAFLTNSNNNGKVISNSTLFFNNTQINFNYDTLMFAAAADSLILNGDYFMEGVITKEGSKASGVLYLSQTGNSYFYDVIIVAELIYLDGIIQYTSPFSLYGNVNVQGTFRNRNSGNQTAYVYGDLNNYGTIGNNSYTNSIYITGDVLQSGIWSNYYNYLSGSSSHSLDQTTPFTCYRIVDTDPLSPLVANSDLVFQNTDVDLGGATLFIENQILSINNSWFINANIESNVVNGFDLSMTGSSYLDNVSLENVTIYDWVRVRGGCSFSGLTTVEGTLSNNNSGNYTLHIDGDIQNNGAIQNYSYVLYLNVDGNVFNNGTWTNAWTQLNGYGGSVNQTIDIQNGNDITGQIRLFSQVATTFNWHWNGSPLGAHPDFSGETSQILNFLVPVSGAYAGTFNCLTDIGWSRDIYVTTNTVATPEVELTVLLEGPFNGTTMDTDLNASGSLPLTQPYNTFPWNYWGTETVGAIPNGNVVDWVYIEYRDAVDSASATEATRIGREAAFLLNDGSVVGLDGVSNLFFSGSVVNKLYVVIHHRNHLDIMSAFALNEVSGVYSYDFTTGAGQAYGTNAQTYLGGSGYGMMGGDANADGSVDTVDKGIWDLQVGSAAGYDQIDLNMDNQVDNLDKNDIWLGNNGESAQIPE